MGVVVFGRDPLIYIRVCEKIYEKSQCFARRIGGFNERPLKNSTAHNGFASK